MPIDPSTVADLRTVGDMKAPPEPTEWANAEHAKASADSESGVRWPYITTAKSVFNNMMHRAGALMWLLPHEVGRHHVLAPDAAARLAASRPAVALPEQEAADGQADHSENHGEDGSTPPSTDAPPASGALDADAGVSGDNGGIAENVAHPENPPQS